MKNRKYVLNIIETIRYMEWKILSVWVDNNCIYAEIKNKYGKIEEVGLYAGSDIDLNNVYEVFEELKYNLNINNMLNDDNILI